MIQDMYLTTHGCAILYIMRLAGRWKNYKILNTSAPKGIAKGYDSSLLC